MARRAAYPLGRLRERVYRAPSPIHGTGCFARAAFGVGDFIGTYAGRPARRDGIYVLWILEEGKAPLGCSGRNLLRWLNHQVPGNARFAGFDLYAQRDIAPGEEITFDYTGGDEQGYCLLWTDTEQPGHGAAQSNGSKLQGVRPIDLDARPKGTAAAV
jgi:hypothetical protein